MRRFLHIVILVSLLGLIAVVPSVLPSFRVHAQGASTTYTVQPGDNLFRISLRFGVTVAALAQANNIANPNLIFVGQVLTIPAPGGTTPPPPTATPVPGAPTATPAPGGTGGGTVDYTVQPGDTLFKIATRFGTTVQAIVQSNGITNPNLIFPGQVLHIVPGTGAVVSGGGSGTSGGSAGGSVPPQTAGGFELGGQVQNFGGNTLAVMQSAKMKWVKFQLAAGDGNGNNLIASAKGAGFRVLFSVVGDKNSVLDGNYQAGYANYVASLAQNGADAIEIWNEENIDREWPTGQINPASYVALLSKAYNAIKAVNRNTIVISGAPSPTGAEGAFGLAKVWNDDHYYSGMAASGAGRVADCIGVHYNEGIISPTRSSGDPRGTYPTRYYSGQLARALASFPGKQACFTELGYLSPEGYGPLPGAFNWAANTTAAQQAQWLGEAVSIASRSGRVRVMIIFNVDFTQYGADPQAGYAMIRPGGTCPACAQIAAVLP